MNRLGRVFKRIGASSAAVAFSQALGSVFGYFKYNKARCLISLVGSILAFAATCSALSFYFSRAEGIVYDTAITDKNVILLQTENVNIIVMDVVKQTVFMSVIVTALKQRKMQKLLVIHLNVVENKFFNVVLKIRYCYASHNDTFFHYEHDDFI